MPARAADISPLTHRPQLITMNLLPVAFLLSASAGTGVASPLSSVELPVLSYRGSESMLRSLGELSAHLPTDMFKTPEARQPTVAHVQPPEQPLAQMPIVEPRDDVDYKLVIQTPDRDIDPRMIIPSPERPGTRRLGKAERRP